MRCFIARLSRKKLIRIFFFLDWLRRSPLGRPDEEVLSGSTRSTAGEGVLLVGLFVPQERKLESRCSIASLEKEALASTAKFPFVTYLLPVAAQAPDDQSPRKVYLKPADYFRRAKREYDSGASRTRYGTRVAGFATRSRRRAEEDCSRLRARCCSAQTRQKAYADKWALSPVPKNLQRQLAASSQKTSVAIYGSILPSGRFGVHECTPDTPPIPRCDELHIPGAVSRTQW